MSCAVIAMLLTTQSGSSAAYKKEGEVCCGRRGSKDGTILVRDSDNADIEEGDDGKPKILSDYRPQVVCT